MSLPQSRIRFTPEEYLKFERASETKHEYIDGFIYAMAGGSPPHNRICFNVSVAIGSQLYGTDCYGYTSDQKIRTDVADLFSYPDLMIACGESLFYDEHKDVLLNPKVIIEVLSPSTESRDRAEKFARYRKIKSLTDYLLIAQDRPCVEHFTRQPGKRKWLHTIETELTAEIKIVSINCTLKLALVYDRIKFPRPRPTLLISPREVRAAKQTRPTKRRSSKR